jgi:hypothetical protein
MQRFKARSAATPRWGRLFLIACAVLAPLAAGAAPVAGSLERFDADPSAPERLSTGELRLRAPMQDLVADIGSDAVEVSSVAEGGHARFSLRVAQLGREGSRAARLRPARLATAGSLVRVDRGAVVEEFSASTRGLRQDFMVSRRPEGTGSLRLSLALAGANAASVDGDQAVALTLRDGRALQYAALHVTDATGRALPASFEVASATRVSIVVDDRDAAYPVRIDPTLSDANWTAFALIATNGDVNAIAKNGGDLYIGGTFTLMGLDVPVNRVAKWNGSTWSALGAGVPSGTVRALHYHAASNRLYIGGSFGVQVWDGTTHSSPDLLPPVFAFASHGNAVYAGVNQGTGGVITTSDGGANWSQVGATFAGGVVALVVDPATGTLYAGGFFDNVGVPANNVARWNGTAWAALGDGLMDVVTCLAWDATQNRLFAGGGFRGTPPTVPDHVAAWNGSAWSSVGDAFTPLPADLNAIAWDAKQGRLFIGGRRLQPQAQALDSPALVWTAASNTWQPTDLGNNNIVRALVFDAATGELHAGGRIFSGGLTSDAAADNVATFVGNTWLGVSTLGTDGPIEKVLRDAARNRLYVIGGFSRIAGVNALSAAMFDGSRWQAMGRGLFATRMQAIALDPGTGDVYVSGSFTNEDGSPGVARWNGTAWTGLGTGIFPAPNALAWDDVNNFLYAGGPFFQAGGVSAEAVARWNGTAWSALAEGVIGGINGVNALAMDDQNARLYVGGDFDTAGNVPHNRIAAWTGFAWLPVGKGIQPSANDAVSALALDAANGKLYVGGTFAAALNPNDAVVNASNVAVYNIGTNTWSALSGGVNGRVLALAYDPVQKLAVGGQFTRASNGLLPVIANNIAQFDGTTWYALGAGVSGFGAGTLVRGLAWDSTQQRLFVAGDYALAGNKPAVFAYADYKQAQSITLGTPPPAKLVPGHTATVSATGGASGNPVVFSSLRPQFCSVTGTTVKALGEGLCVIGVDQAGNATFADAPQKSISIRVTSFSDGFENF